ncbi:putative cysteine desulfurase [Vibrio scophthalmi]|uniref:cysteine desulfurase-like protein n=1 Tax=Vibrio scophthalmi TaxID=45658 RepID=UPI000809321B|nr:cysteine desulfurase-like protein [Vibrio scophthalmi]ANS85690.1 putative cysteine desulfurase [Vibrio scophthalmi]
MSFTPERVRAQFSALHQRHNNQSVSFFDGPGGAQVPMSVLDAMSGYLGYSNANLGGHYFTSYKTNQLLNDARISCQALLNAPSADSIVFGGNMTSLTFSLSRAISRNWQAGDEVIVTALDHYANVSTWQQAAEDKSVQVFMAKVDPEDCSVDIEHLLSLINEKTRLIAITLASNTTGSIVDIAPVIAAAKAVDAQVYVDAVHYAPHHLIDVQALECDFLVCSAYKFCGPHIGIAYIAPKWLQRLQPYKVEPATDLGPGRFETGTQSFEALAGLVATIEYLAQWADERLTLRERLEQSFKIYNRYETQLSDYFLLRLGKMKGATLWGRDVADANLRTPTFALTFAGIDPVNVAKALGEQNICLWSGHFYALGLVRQLDLEKSGGVVRIGMMHYNTKAEIDRLFDALKPFCVDG